MFKNYFKTAIRNLIKGRGYSVINIIGLAAGIAVCILILLWVQDEINYDRYHNNLKSIYRVCISYDFHGQNRNHWRTPPPLAEALKNEYPEIISAARYTTNRGELTVKYEDKIFREMIGFGDPELFNMLTIPFITGDPVSSFNHPYSAVISESMAHKYFGDQNPVGKIIRIEDQFDLTVTGIIEDIPDNSYFKAECFTQFVTMAEFFGEENLNDWGDFGFNTFLLLQPDTDDRNLNSKIHNFLIEINPESGTTLFLQPLADMHLYDINGGGIITYVYIFSSIAVFILLIACINYTNLATARAIRRAREIGMRKVVGAGRNNIRLQFIGESIIYSVASLLVALALVELLIPVFNQLTGKQLDLRILDFNIITAIAILAIVTGLFSGGYPALYLASFTPVDAFKGRAGGSSTFLRKLLVVAQFAISIILIICTMVVSGQLDFMKNKKLGFARDNIIYLPLNNSLRAHHDSFKSELLANSNIKTVTSTSSRVGIAPKWSSHIFTWEGNDTEQELITALISVDYDFANTFDIQMADGRFFSEEFSDDTNAVVLNEAAIRRMSMADPVGKWFANDATIIGVVKDFHFRPLQSEIEPLCLVMMPDWDSHLAIRIKPDNIPSTLAYIKNSFSKFAPEFPFEYHFLDDDFYEAYKSEQRLGTIFKYFTGLAIIISCLGLLGLSSYAAEMRTKEIGIRKVLGASVPGILKLMTREFIILILVANIIAWPVAYYAMSRWLRDFAYRIPVEWYVFIMAALITLIVAMATIGYQAIKAAQTNPVKTLKYE
jgi:ABC-type antimicrobial peptide transport system permease subunit